MTKAEMKKVLVVEKILDGSMTNVEGAAVLGITPRQIIRLKKKYMQGGAAQIAHQNRGRKPPHALEDSLKEHVAYLYTHKYHGSNSCHFAELLQEHESITLSSPSIRRILSERGLKQMKPRRRSKTHQPRKRKPQSGMLWQIDATPYSWLEERSPAFALHAAIDDATGTVVGALFCRTECREGYSVVMQQGLLKYGVPLGLYSDRHTIFRSPNEKLSLEQELAGERKPLSNFGKAMADLHIEHIKAVTPQAKGRVERLWVTLQDRLVIELRLLGINTMEEANRALPSLIQKHNRQFAVRATQTESAYVKLDPNLKLNYVFTRREYRQLGTGNTLSYRGKLYTLAKPAPFQFRSKTTVEVRETLEGNLILWHQGQALDLKETERIQRNKETKKASSAQPRKPAASHPWRAWNTKHSQNNINDKAVQAP